MTYTPNGTNAMRLAATVADVTSRLASSLNEEGAQDPEVQLANDFFHNLWLRFLIKGTTNLNISSLQVVFRGPILTEPVFDHLPKGSVSKSPRYSWSDPKRKLGNRTRIRVLVGIVIGFRSKRERQDSSARSERCSSALLCNHPFMTWWWGYRRRGH